MKLFRTDGGFYKFMMQLMELLELNFLWIVCSLPVVTIGASTAAACAVTMKMAKNEESYIGRQFLKEFKNNLKQGTIIWILMMLVGYAFYLDTQILKVSGNPSYLTIFMTFALGMLFIICFGYAFALIARYQNSIKNTILNSIKITFHHLGRTIAMLFSLALIYIILSFNAVMLIFMILIGPGCMLYTYGFFCREIFEKIEKSQE
ncbi:YesL family protein [[Clostridium] polysaccharolyticum]|uniref:Uncharacterized membrane protein YesL n=1 Tax=[Clostridium] polysaccharolyticum TaxID=29364 RepID=A0A1I0EPF6_9FIRM|nr:YesL family protein [[Clostridium] polysaccharolyticum]SET46629.1 Uncharacterized membrane protein YesL [[Clostridium] polysaccharolyticum]